MPVEMLNVAVVAFAATVTDAGAVRTPAALLVNVTVAPPAAGAGATVTVHVVFPLDDNVVAVQANPLTLDGTSSEILAVAVVPFSVPVRVAV